MTYPYIEVTSTIRRPIIQILVFSKQKFAVYPVLIDSGADYCIFSIELAENLGITLSKTPIRFRGIGQSKVMGRWGEVELKVAGISFKTSVLFAKISEFGHGILGQQGFFDQFDVNLSYNNKSINIVPAKLKN